MVNKKISELDPAAAITGTETIPLLQAGATKAATVAQLLASVLGANPVAGLSTLKALADAIGDDPNYAADLVTALQAKADPPITDTGSGYTTRPASSTLPAGRALYQGANAPSDALTGDKWQPVYTPRPVIIDTDWYTDVDDAVAMRLAAHYERIGKFDILACIVDTTAPNGAPSLDAFWRTENRPMQIGQLPGANSDLTAGGAYQAGLLTLPHYGTAADVYPDSTTVYRTTLAAAADGSVDIVSIGYLNALSALLQSPADGIDARTGAALVTAKVRRLYVMGGAYPSGTENNFNRSTKAIAAANYVVGNWPATIYFSGFEVGNTVITGGNLASLVPASDPLYAALVAHGSPTGRSSWDPMTVALAANGTPTAAGYTTVRGTNTVNASTGANTFTVNASGPHYYVVKAQTDATFQAAINDLLVPGRQPKPPTGLQVLTATGWKPASYLDRNLGRNSPLLTGATDLGALAALKATDVAVADGTAIATVSGAASFPTWTQAAGTNQPTYIANSNGRAALRFAGNQWLETASTVPQTQPLTVYARVLWATLPAANQTIVADDDGSTSPTIPDRSFHLKGIAAATAQAAVFVNNAGTMVGVTDNNTSLVANTWHLLALKRTQKAVEVFIDGVSNGSTATFSNFDTLFANLTLHVGASKHSGTTATEGLSADVAEVRIYASAHSTAQMATVAASM